MKYDIGSEGPPHYGIEHAAETEAAVARQKKAQYHGISEAGQCEYKSREHCPGFNT
jgi:hypothetical protein